MILGENMSARAATGTGQVPSAEAVVWEGRPSIGTVLILYGIMAAAIAILALVAELGLAQASSATSVLTASGTVGSLTIPYALEVLTIGIILIGYLGEVIGLAIFKARNRYELRTDGLYIRTGIANLEDVFVSPMAFSDARLIRPLSARLIGRSTIVVDANDKRRFVMKFIKDGQNVQSLIRRNLAHPVVRLEQGQVVVQPPR
jgi:hypothetical protein